MSAILYDRPEAEAIETQLTQLAPRFDAVLGQIMKSQRLIRTIMISLEKTPKLYECDRQSVFNAAMSAACLGLECDGVTGQSFILPFAGKAQLITGYKGYNTLGARSSYAIRGAVIRDGDGFESDAADGVIRHHPIPNSSARIIGSWARAVSHALPAFISVLWIDELMAVKAKAPGGKKPDSPWNQPAIGFPAMCEKTAKRRLARCMPLNVMQLAAAMDEAVEERGLHSWITPERGVIIDVAGEVLAPTIDTTPVIDLDASEFSALPGELATRALALKNFINSADSTVQLAKRWGRAESSALRDQIRMVSTAAVDVLVDAHDKRHAALSELEESLTQVSE